MHVWSTVHAGFRRGTVGFGGLVPAVLAGTVHIAVLIALAVLAMQQPDVGGEQAGDDTLHLTVDFSAAEPGETDDATAPDQPQPETPTPDPQPTDPDPEPPTPEPDPQEQARDELDEQARQLALEADRQAARREEEDRRARQQEVVEQQRRERQQAIRDEERQRELAEREQRRLDEVRRLQAERERALLEQRQAQKVTPTDPETLWREDSEDWDQSFDRIPIPDPPAPQPTPPNSNQPPANRPPANANGGGESPSQPRLTPEQARWRSERLYRYRDGVVRRIERAKHYPALAARRNQQGKVVVELTINAKGELTGAPTIKKSSGYELLDDEAVACIKRAAPFGSLPDDRAGYTFDIVIEFRLK